MRLIRFWLEYAALRLFQTLMRPLSFEAASDLGASVGYASRWLLRRRWHMTLDNLGRAFPGKSPHEVKRVARTAWRNAGRVFIELMKSDELSDEQMRERVRFDNIELVRECLAEGKGVILNCAHIGNWELTGSAVAAHGLPIAVVGRAMKNPWTDAWLVALRQRNGLHVIKHKNPFFSSVKWLKGNGLVGVLIDHSIRVGGIFVPFFGRPTATSTLSGLLAVRLGAPVLTVQIRREGHGQRVTFLGPLRADPAANAEKEVERMTVAMSQVIEEVVRQTPEDWLWGHNRWRRFPAPGEEVVHAA